MWWTKPIVLYVSLLYFWMAPPVVNKLSVEDNQSIAKLQSRFNWVSSSQPNHIPLELQTLPWLENSSKSLQLPFGTPECTSKHLNVGKGLHSMALCNWERSSTAVQQALWIAISQFWISGVYLSKLQQIYTFIKTYCLIHKKD